MVLIARSSLVEQPHGLFDQKPRHPAPDDQDRTDYQGSGIDVLGAPRHGLVTKKPGAGLEFPTRAVRPKAAGEVLHTFVMEAAPIGWQPHQLRALRLRLTGVRSFASIS
jgi:hypothetical protein